MYINSYLGKAWNYEYRTNGLGSWIADHSNLPLQVSEMISEDHLPLNTEIDDGGPWYLHKYRDITDLGYLYNDLYKGGFSVSPKYDLPDLTAAAPTLDSQLNADGTTAIARCEPTNPAFAGSYALGELIKDGLPGVSGTEAFRSRAESFRNKQRAAGSEYLNVQFGWLPFVADIRKFAYAVTHSHEIISQYHRSSRQKIRRRYVLVDNTETVCGTSSGFTPIPARNGIGFLTGYQCVRRIEKRWFSGAFKYYLPLGDDWRTRWSRYYSDARKLLGVEFTPETLWDLAPWSWAADWEGNIGDVMHNIAALGRDGLVLQYGYSMASSQKEYTLAVRTDSNHGSIPTTRKFSHTYRQRMPSTPYGFGVSSDSLSAKQIAILIALGLSVQ